MLRFLAIILLSFSTKVLALPVLLPIYNANGHNNTPNSFTMVIAVNDPGRTIVGNYYAQAEYSELNNSARWIKGDTESVTIRRISRLTAFNVQVRGLRETTVYRARVTLFRATDSGLQPVQTTPVYYTTTTGNDPKSIIRNRMLLKGFKEYGDSELGFVGAGGTIAVDGTRYGASPGELWCSEFYSWVGAGSLKGIDGLSNVEKLTLYFGRGGGLMNRSGIPTKARRGDYVSMDTDLKDGANHSGMFLAYEVDGGREWVWTLEGNSGEKVKVNRRPYDKVFVVLGHITDRMF